MLDGAMDEVTTRALARPARAHARGGLWPAEPLGQLE